MAPGASLTHALHLGANSDPGTSRALSQPPLDVRRFPVNVGLHFPCASDVGEGWLENLGAAQRHFFILAVFLLVWCQTEPGVPQGPLARFWQREKCV